MAQSLSCVLIHAVFSTKHRQPFLRDPSLRKDVHAYIGGVSSKLGCPPIAVGGADDHVHVFVRFGRTLTIADWVKEVKRVSSAFVSPDFAWQSGCAVFSVDPLNLARISAYVSNQDGHHLEVSFQDELRHLMQEHGIEWDERYVWD